MRIKINNLKTDRQWRSATGNDEKRFKKLALIFSKAYEEEYGESFESMRSRSPAESAIESSEELLFFTLFSLKAGLTYDNLGLVMGMDGSNAKRNQDVGLKVLQKALVLEGSAPQRGFESVEAFQTYFQGEDVLLLDATEQRRERPQNDSEQSENYSGKKKLTPLKRSSFRRQTNSLNSSAPAG
jgi:hypothetical protein